jgi:hypothetical protein
MCAPHMQIPRSNDKTSDYASQTQCSYLAGRIMSLAALVVGRVMSDCYSLSAVRWAIVSSPDSGMTSYRLFIGIPGGHNILFGR